MLKVRKLWHQESWYQVRASENVVKNQGSGLDILIALNEDALNRHTNPGINEGGASPLSGIAIFDGEMITNYKKYQKPCFQIKILI